MLMLNLVVSSISVAVPFTDGQTSGTRWVASCFSVHPDVCSKHDGLLFPTVKEAQAAAMVWIKSPGVILAKADKDAKKAEKQAENAAKRATSAVSKKAEKLAAETAILTAKKERLDAFAEAGTFALVG
jgi:hypothetical protein